MTCHLTLYRLLNLMFRCKAKLFNKQSNKKCDISMDNECVCVLINNFIFFFFLCFSQLLYCSEPYKLSKAQINKHIRTHSKSKYFHWNMKSKLICWYHYAVNVLYHFLSFFYYLSFPLSHTHTNTHTHIHTHTHTHTHSHTHSITQSLNHTRTHSHTHTLTHTQTHTHTHTHTHTLLRVKEMVRE